MEFTDCDYSAGHSLLQSGVHLCQQYKSVVQLLPKHKHTEMLFRLETLIMTHTVLNVIQMSSWQQSTQETIECHLWVRVYFTE